MLRSFLPFLWGFVFIANAAFSQQEFSLIGLRVRNPKDAIGTSDTFGNIAYIFEGHKQYQITLLSDKGVELNNFIANRPQASKKESLIGAALRDSLYVAYFYSKKYDTFSSLVVNLYTGVYTFQDIHNMNANDEFLRAFSMNGSFYILTVPKQKNILNIYVCGDGKKVDAGSYPIEMTTFYATLSSNNNNLNEAAESQVGIETVRSRLDNNIKSAYPKKKLYFQDNKIYLSFDEPNSTHLVIIDVYASKSFYKKLNFSLEQGNNSSEKRGNSFLYENKLFRATVSPEMLNISIIDLDSIRLINSYNIYPDIDITIANGPIKQESGMNTIITDEKVLHKTSQYFKRVLNGNLSIAANRSDSGRVVVEVGSYEEIITRSGGGFGTPGLSFGMGMGMGMGMGSVGFGNPYGFGNVFNPGFNGGPGSNYPFYNSGNGNMRLRFVSFKSLFSEPTYHHLEGKVPKMLHEKINDYLSNRFVHHTPELSIITPYREQKLLMGYYMKNVNKFEIIAFDKISNFP